MRTLLLLICLPVLAWGQGTYILEPTTLRTQGYDSYMIWFHYHGDRVHFGKKESCDTQTTPDTVHSWWFQKQVTTHVLTQLVEFWGEYKDSCWADSTQHKVPYDCPMPGCAVAHADVWEWFHREPTLDGFMDFVRRRVR